MEETEFLVNGFRNGFPIGYEGEKNIRMTANNSPLKLGTRNDIWLRLMKEVKLGRVAGPFRNIPFKYYIQSPIGMVAKQQPGETRLIFHLSYPRDKPTSENYNTPKEKCTIKYKHR